MNNDIFAGKWKQLKGQVKVRCSYTTGPACLTLALELHSSTR